MLDFVKNILYNINIVIYKSSDFSTFILPDTAFYGIAKSMKI